MAYSILVIDDNADLRENTAEILELAGYKTFTAENGKKGVEIALREKPTLVVCDIMMPELDGYGVLHLLRKNPDTRHIPLVFLTAKAERSDLRRGMEMGADDYITKPFDDIELLNAVETRLKRLEFAGQLARREQPVTKDGFNVFMADIMAATDLRMASTIFESVNFAKKQVVFSEGKRPRFLYYIVSGKVKLAKGHEEGKEYITDIYGAGDFIGYTPLIEDSHYTETATVLEDAELIQVPKDHFLKLLFSDIGIASEFVRLIAHNVREKEERLLNLAYSSLRKRIAHALVEIAARYSGQGTTAVLEISREEIAQYVGTATESLIRTLSDFREEGLIKIEKGRIMVSDKKKLKHLLR